MTKTKVPEKKLFYSPTALPNFDKRVPLVKGHLKLVLVASVPHLHVVEGSFLNDCVGERCQDDLQEDSKSVATALKFWN